MPNYLSIRALRHTYGHNNFRQSALRILERKDILMEYIEMEIARTKNIVLVAHDHKKRDLLD